jgi:hypothetical protein
MAIGLYLDHHIPRAIADQLRLRGIDILTTLEDGTNRLADPLLLDRATELKRPLVTSDTDLLIDAQRRQQAEIPFAGVIFRDALSVTIGQAVNDLELIAKAAQPSELDNQVIFLPF